MRTLGPPIAESLFATAPEPGRSASLVASSTLRPTPPKMDRAILSYSPPLKRAILRRLTRAPTLMLDSMPVPGPWVGECLLASSRSQ